MFLLHNFKSLKNNFFLKIKIFVFYIFNHKMHFYALFRNRILFEVLQIGTYNPKTASPKFDFFAI